MNRWKWLKERLHELNSNPAEFARKLNWNPARVYGLFSGTTKKIPQDKIVLASQLLKVDIQSLLDFNNQNTDQITFGITSSQPSTKKCIDAKILAFILKETEKWCLKNEKVFSTEDLAEIIAFIYNRIDETPVNEARAKVYDILELRESLSKQKVV